jgi:hypothetical protein
MVIALASLTACSVTTSNMDGGMDPVRVPGYPQDYERVYQGALSSFASMGWFLSTEEMASGLIAGWTGMNLLTYGDSITIRVVSADTARGDTLTRVGFSSWTPQATDWGRGNTNQRRFYTRLAEVLAQPPSVPINVGTIKRMPPRP